RLATESFGSSSSHGPDCRGRNNRHIAGRSKCPDSSTLRRHAPSRATETWRIIVRFATVGGDWVRQAEADCTMALSCPNSSMAPVLAVAGMVADHHRFDDDSTPLESFINLSSPGRARSIPDMENEMAM